MNKTETIQAIKTLAGYYPLAFRDLTTDRVASMIDAWAAAFADEPADTVNAAITNLAKKMRFLPSVAEVAAEVAATNPCEAANGDDLTPTQEAWASALIGPLSPRMRREWWHFFNDPPRAEFLKGCNK